ncbi:MAG TPA: carbon-nitrogen hydrolase family protein [Candidatus Hydrogenedentes bacterium]|nr:carbon-nitrogen hydrolase family protein [Candidatus Hydrogenedentota bacterium]
MCVRAFAGVMLGLALVANGDETAFPESLRIAAVQMEVTPSISTNLARIERGINEAADSGARVVLFPETALSGFDKDTVAKIDWDALRAAMDQIAAAAKRRAVYVLYGSATKSDHEKPFNSAILLRPDGIEEMRYHKMVPEGHFQPGDHLALFEVDGVPATVIICHDERYPELVRIPVLAGARICFYISYEINALPDALRKADGYRAQLVARAAENGIWVMQSNGIGPLTGSAAVSLGQSRAVNPGGTVMEELPAMKDAMYVVDIEPKSANRGNALRSAEIGLLRDWWAEGLKKVKRP